VSSDAGTWSYWRICTASQKPRGYVQVLRLCQKSGLVQMGPMALDGTKVEAKVMSHERMEKSEQQLRQERRELLRKAELIDAQEDGRHGKGKRGSERPEQLQRRESRLEKIRQAKAELEAEAAAAQARRRQKPQQLQIKTLSLPPASGRRCRG